MCVLLGHIWLNVTQYIYSSTVPLTMYLGISIFLLLTLSPHYISRADIILSLSYIYLENFTV